MANNDVWEDFETFEHNLKYFKVDHLKQVVAGFNEECGSNLTKSGKKADLIDRIFNELRSWRRRNDVDRWMKGKALGERVRRTGTYTVMVPDPPPPRSYQPMDPSVPYTPGRLIPRYDPYAPPRRPTQSTPAASSSTSAAPPAPMPLIRFKFSPFFKVDSLVSKVVECPESTTSMDRRSQSVTFVMTSDMLNKLNSQSPKYQLRLYCTSSTYYTPPGQFISPTSTPCPIEFPPTCEVRVNGTQLNANLKGLKKKPGTAPPPDLAKVVRMNQSSTNRVEIIYVNSQQPTPPKKYYLVVMLVEVTTVDQLVERLRKGKYRRREDILADMNKSASEDEDIIAGHQKMSLKCPLSYMRIQTPCRSSCCVHPQCFDAMSWFSVMEQTTTWMCPVCEKVLNVEDLIIDGYFDDILKQTPEDVEDVIVEADGQWHTEDNKYGSAEWKAAHPVGSPPKPATPAKRAPSPVKPTANGVDGKDKPRLATPIEISDDEDEDEGRVKRELSPSTDGFIPRASRPAGSSQPTRSQTQAPDIIDLTLSDDDEPPPPRPSAPVAPTAAKRKETHDLPSPTEQIWKKSRTESGSSPSSTFSELVNSSTLRMADEVAASRRLAPLPSSSQSRYPSSSQAGPYRGSGTGSHSYSSTAPLPPQPSSVPQRPATSSHDAYRNPLPPLQPFVSQRGNGAGSSSPQHWR
ncbi:PINIT domain-containing protein [Cerioporus squamosus]|nr:PINIT domain-containing protein [Cerioporus squamosus]